MALPRSFTTFRKVLCQPRVLAAAERQHRVQCRWKQPPRTAFTLQLPSRLVEIDHQRQRQQFAQGVELRRPVPSQWIQQRVGLRFLDRTLAEEPQPQPRNSRCVVVKPALVNSITDSHCLSQLVVRRLPATTPRNILPPPRGNHSARPARSPLAVAVPTAPTVIRASPPAPSTVDSLRSAEATTPEPARP